MSSPKPKDSSVEELLQHSKIVSLYNGYLDPKRDNLKAILEAVDSSKFPDTSPVAFFAVIGPRSSGKTFLTNCLIQYFKFGEEGGWMSDIMKKSENGEPMMERGFSWDSVSHPNFYQPLLNSAATSGIYLWPEPFLIKKSSGTKVVVWIMHLHYGDEERDQDMGQLEKFLVLACSRIMEIHWKNTDFRLLEHIHNISSNLDQQSSEDISLEELCTSSVFVIRSGNKKTTKALSDDKAKEFLLQYQEKSDKKMIYQEILDKLQYVNVVGLRDSSEALHNRKGILNPAEFRPINLMIRKAVETMVDETEVEGKLVKGSALVLGNMFDFLINTAKIIDSRTVRDPKRKNEKKETYTVTVSSCEEIKFRSTNITTENNGLIQKFTTDYLSQSHRQHEKTESKGCAKSMQRDTSTNPGSAAKLHYEYSNYQPSPSTSAARHSYVETNSFAGSGRNEEENLSLDQTNNHKIEVDHSYCTPQARVKHETESPVDHTEAEPSDMEIDVDLDQSDQSWEFLDAPCSEQQPQQPVCTGTKLLETSIDEAIQEEKMDVDSQPKLDDALKNLQEQQLKLMEQLEEEKRLVKEAEKQRKAEEKAERERLKREREEKARQEMEEARSVMNDVVPVVVTEIQKALPFHVQRWITNDLSLNNLNQIPTIYTVVLDQTIELHRGVVDPKLWQEFRNLVDKNCNTEITRDLQSISKALMQIKSGITKQFDFHGYFTPTRVEEIVWDEFKKATKNITDALNVELIGIATEKLLTIFKFHNEQIQEIEKVLYKDAMSHVTIVYARQMQRYLKDAPYGPDRLKRIHWKLSTKLMDAFQKACSLGKNPEEKTAQDVSMLKQEMDQAFISFQQQNEKELTRLQKETDKVIKNMKTMYTEKIEEVLKNNLDGLDAKSLQKHQESIQSEVMKLLEMEIKRKIRVDEPLDNHKKVVQIHIDDYWKEVLKVNSSHLKSKQERDEIERQNKRREASAKKLELQQIRSRTSSSNRRGSSTRTQPIQDSRPVLPPLIFHLQSLRITMSMEHQGHVMVVKNELGEDATSPVVLITRQNHFLYGTEALAFMHADQSITSNNAVILSLEDLFLAEEKDLAWSTRISLDNKEYFVGAEFLLAFLLGKLKQAPEREMNGHCEVAALVIPFWLSSTQRIMIKDAAKLAGFKQVYLINEASAAAYNFILKRPEQQLEVLVISEHLDRVDTFVFSYKEWEKKLTMVGHSSNYDAEDLESKDWWLKRLIKRGASNVGKFISSKLEYFLWNEDQEVTDDEKNKVKRMVRKACKSAVERAQGELHRKLNLHEYLIICENFANWGPILEDVAREFGRKPNDIKEANAVRVGAAGVLSKGPDNIRFGVRDLLSNDVVHSVNGTIISRSKLLPLKPKKHNALVPFGHSYAEIYQTICGNKHSIGIISRQRFLYRPLEISLQITNEAIVTLQSVQNPDSDSYDLPDHEYEWKTLNLSEDHKNVLADLLSSVLIPPAPLEDTELTQAKTDLLQKCQEMIEKVGNGELKIRSQLVKDKVLEQIRDAEQFAKHENSTLDSVQKHMGLLEKLYEKYDKKK